MDSKQRADAVSKHSQNSRITANTIKVGQKVTTSGFPGTVRAVCEWSRTATDVMVEVKLASGVCCVSVRDLEAA